MQKYGIYQTLEGVFHSRMIRMFANANARMVHTMLNVCMLFRCVKKQLQEHERVKSVKDRRKQRLNDGFWVLTDSTLLVMAKMREKSRKHLIYFFSAQGRNPEILH